MRQVDFVQNGHDGQACVHSKPVVCNGLRLNPLRGVHEQQAALARRQGALHLVAEVHVPGRVDQVQQIRRSRLGRLRREEETGRLSLDGDAARALDLKAVQVLLAAARRNRARELQQAVRQRRLAVVDVSAYREVAHAVLLHGRIL